MDMLLNNMNSKDDVLKAFPLECLEQFKPVVDILHAMLTWQGRLVEMSMLTNTVERIKSFFEQLRRKLYSRGRDGQASFTGSRTRVDSTNNSGEYKEYTFADSMSQFLEMMLQESTTTLNKYVNHKGFLLIRCYYVQDIQGQDQ